MREYNGEQNRELSKAERQLLECLRAYSHGDDAQNLMGDAASEDWLQLHALSFHHKLVAVVYDGIKAFKGFCGTAFASKWCADARKQAILQSYATDSFLQKMQRIYAQGIEAVVLKGIVCRSLYKNPEYRPSCDEDVYYPKYDFERAISAFRANGYTLEIEDNEGVYNLKGEDNTSVELHKHLFSRTGAFASLNDYFEREFDNAVYTEADGLRLRVFEPTTGLFYLIVHAAKHFVSCGFGVRTIADIARYADAHSHEIDRSKLAKLTEDGGLFPFALNLFAIAQIYLGFDAACVGLTCAQLDEADPMPMLLDCLDGGLYGKSSLERIRSHRYTKGVAAGKGARRPVWEWMFPSREFLAIHHPYVKKSRLLVPVAWAERLLKYLLSGRRDAQAGVTVGMERAKLIRKYGIGAR